MGLYQRHGEAQAWGYEDWCDWNRRIVDSGDSEGKTLPQEYQQIACKSHKIVPVHDVDREASPSPRSSLRRGLRTGVALMQTLHCQLVLQGRERLWVALRV